LARLFRLFEINCPFINTLKSSCVIAGNPVGGVAIMWLLKVATGLDTEFAIAVVFSPTNVISADVIPPAAVEAPDTPVRAVSKNLVGACFAAVPALAFNTSVLPAVSIPYFNVALEKNLFGFPTDVFIESETIYPAIFI
jgi:hypothetical protein